MGRPFKLGSDTKGWIGKHDYKKRCARWFRRQEKIAVRTDPDNAEKKYRYLGWY